MKKTQLLRSVLAATLLCYCTQGVSQTYVKLNLPYTAIGVINPAAEFTVSPKSTVQGEIIISPWKSINGKHAEFAIFMGEYRRYLRQHNQGWYLGANIGMMAFDLSKPYIEEW